VRIPLAGLAALSAAMVWTAAWLSLTRGEVSAIGIGFAAVLVGLGIDYAIHGGARFRQHLLDCRDPAAALATTYGHAGPGILTSALTTGAAFAVLALAHFRPLHELGQVVAAGILLILVASASIGAAVLLVAPTAGMASRRVGWLWRLMGRAVDALVNLATRRPRRVLGAALLISLLALVGISRLRLDADLGSLRPANHPALEAEELLADRFDLGLDTATVILHGDDLPAVLHQCASVERLLRQHLGTAVDIVSPALWLGADADQRLRLLTALPWADAGGRLQRELHAVGLNPEGFASGLQALRALGSGQDPGFPPVEQWPDWLSELVRLEPDGAVAAVRVRLPADHWPEGPPRELVAAIREHAPGSAVASAVAVGTDIRALAGRDLRSLSLLALVAVVVVVMLSFRGRLRSSMLAVTPVVLGSLWVLGLWGGLGGSLDLLSLAILPIILGIGIDDGLHAVHGARRAPAEGLCGSVRAAGRAMVLTTVTTCVGFLSLTLSHVPGLRSGGLLVSVGVLACLAATLLVLPALEAAIDVRRATGDR
jgi:predicted RND superfamily exporter protein